MIDWPEALPDRPFKNATIALVAGLNDEKESLNPERTRTYPEEETTFSFFMNSSQFAVFRSFLEISLNGGCASFTAPWLPCMGFSFHFLRIRKAPTWQPVGKYWRVVMPVEIIAGVETDGEGNPAIWTSEE